MSRSDRQDTLVRDTVTLQVDIEQYTAVTRDGEIAAADADAFGIAMTSGNVGDPVPVCRFGFCPVRVETAAGNTSDKTALAVGDLGLLKALPAEAGTYNVVALSEEATAADGAQTGAWVDCLSYGREVTVSGT